MNEEPPFWISSIALILLIFCGYMIYRGHQDGKQWRASHTEQEVCERYYGKDGEALPSARIPGNCLKYFKDTPKDLE